MTREARRDSPWHLEVLPTQAHAGPRGALGELAHMNETAKNYLRYVRASLADATRLRPNLPANAVEISFDAIEQGKFDQHTTGQIFEIAKKTEGRQLTDAERLWPIRLMVCLRVYARRPEHG